MALDAIRRLSEVAEYQWGLVTTDQAAQVDVARIQLTRFAAAGVIERIGQGVYRVTAAPAHEHEQILAAWLGVGGGFGTDAREVVVGGAAATRLHGMGDIWLTSIDLITPTPRRTRRESVRLRTIQLDPRDVGPGTVGVPTMTPARAIADLVELGEDYSIVADALRDGLDAGVMDLDRAAELLTPHAAAAGKNDGRALLDWLLGSVDRAKV